MAKKRSFSFGNNKNRRSSDRSGSLLEAAQGYLKSQSQKKIDEAKAALQGDVSAAGPADFGTRGVSDVVEVPDLIRSGNEPDIGEFEALGDVSLEKPDILQEAEDVVSELLSGEIPEDVMRELEQTTAEKNIQTGIVGQSADFSVANAIGLTSLDLALKGIEAATSLGDIDSRRVAAEAELNAQLDISNQNMQMSYEQLKENARQWEDRMVLSLEEVAQNWDRISLQATEIVSANQRHMQSLINELVISDSRDAITGLQEHVTSLEDFFGVSNEAILAIFGITKR